MSCFIKEANKISLTADLWSKKGLTSSYLGITGHFFSWKDRWNHCVMLAVCRLPPSHTVNVRATMEEVLSEWEIPHTKVSAILTDNGSNIVAAVWFELVCDSEDDESDSGEEEEEEDVELDFEAKERDHEVTFSSFKRVSCFAHTLQLVVHKFDQAANFKDGIKCSHRLVSKVSTSTKATEKLIGLCGKKLVRAVPTR